MQHLAHCEQRTCTGGASTSACPVPSVLFSHHRHTNRSKRKLIVPLTGTLKSSTTLVRLVPRRMHQNIVCDATSSTSVMADSSYVTPLPLEMLRAIHSRAFGHRNVRTYIVALYSPDAQAWYSAEEELERLAYGLRHTRMVVVSKMDVGSGDPREFASQVLGVRVGDNAQSSTHLPVVLMYPEASPGLMRYNGASITAESLLESLNAYYRLAIPSRGELQLKGVAPRTLPLYMEAPLDTPTTPWLMPRPIKSLQSVHPAEAANVTGAVRGTTGTRRQLLTTSRSDADASAAAQLPRYWTQDKITFWLTIAVLSVVLLAWEKWLQQPALKGFQRWQRSVSGGFSTSTTEKSKPNEDTATDQYGPIVGGLREDDSYLEDVKRYDAPEYMPLLEALDAEIEGRKVDLEALRKRYGKKPVNDQKSEAVKSLEDLERMSEEQLRILKTMEERSVRQETKTIEMVQSLGDRNQKS